VAQGVGPEFKTQDHKKKKKKKGKKEKDGTAVVEGVGLFTQKGECEPTTKKGNSWCVWRIQ
jgi:hypothetical protein